MKKIAVISLLGLGLAASVNLASSAAETDGARAPEGTRVYASYASPHTANTVIAAVRPQERDVSVARATGSSVSEDPQARVSTDEYVSAHFLATGQYRGEETPKPRLAGPQENS